MLLNTLQVKNSRGGILDLPLADVGSGFVVKNIDGLDPVKATIVSSSFANQDGEQYQSSRREVRNIKITLGLDPDYTVMSTKQLRDQLYSFFMPKTEAILTFHMLDYLDDNILTNTLDLDIDARIEEFISPLFAKDPQADLSLTCFDPDFYNPLSTVFSGSTVSTLAETILPYEGSVDTGIVFTLRPDRDISAFTIFHRPSDQTLHTVDFSYPVLAGDVVAISSVFGSKYVTLTRGGVESSILYAVTPQSDWLRLQPGDNYLRVYAEGAPMPFDVEYNAKYGGL